MLSILGLVICVGLLVDNSVVAEKYLSVHAGWHEHPLRPHSGCERNRLRHHHGHFDDSDRVPSGIPGRGRGAVFPHAPGTAHFRRIVRLPVCGPGVHPTECVFDSRIRSAALSGWRDKAPF